jgi:tRNA uridine 5-carbamoylmethylation protein Kti12
MSKYARPKYKAENYEPFIVLMTGPPLSSKSTIACYLTKRLRVNALLSGYLFDYPPDEIAFINDKYSDEFIETRNKRKKCLNEIFRAYHKHGVSFIADSAFSSIISRQEYYEIIENEISLDSELEYSIILIWCHCKDDEILQKRIQQRRNDPYSHESSISNWKLVKELHDNYQDPISIRHRDCFPISKEAIEIVEVDSAKNEVKIHPSNNSPSELSVIISALIKDMNSYFESVFRNKRD